MSAQPILKLFSEAKMLPPMKPKPKLPPRRTNAPKRHWALARMNSSLPPRAREASPLPVWTCDLNLYGFKSEKDAKAFLEKNKLSNVWSIWLCDCGWWHYECYPREATGESSGKDVRKIAWMIRRGLKDHIKEVRTWSLALIVNHHELV